MKIYKPYVLHSNFSGTSNEWQAQKSCLPQSPSPADISVEKNCPQRCVMLAPQVSSAQPVAKTKHSFFHTVRDDITQWSFARILEG